MFYASRMTQAYQPIARRYRPQTFSDVVGQKAIVQTLTNALSSGNLGHAYLFCGTRGTGKTSIARIFAKALNCTSPQGVEPCNQCSSCLDIIASRSLDVIEIDGASNRGIDDARNITETSVYTPSSGKYKIYIIDEVHMLTKEAFNALLKTLEEPPKSVKFFFATTEPQKVPATIISRCQRFDLKRISPLAIEEKITEIAHDMNKKIEKAAISMIVELAEGSLRDAQSLLDRVLCYDDLITQEVATELLGQLPQSLLSALDEAVVNGDISFAFSFSEEIFKRGKEFSELLDELISHFRTHLQRQLQSSAHSSLYTTEELLYLMDLLFGVRQRLKHLSRAHLEVLLTKIIRCKDRITPSSLLQKLENTRIEESPPVEKEKPTVSSEKKELVSIPFATQKSPEIKEEAAKKEDSPSLSLERAHLETMLRFASVELEGTLTTPPQSE